MAAAAAAAPRLGAAAAARFGAAAAAAFRRRSLRVRSLAASAEATGAKGESERSAASKGKEGANRAMGSQNATPFNPAPFNSRVYWYSLGLIGTVLFTLPVALHSLNELKEDQNDFKNDLKKKHRHLKARLRKLEIKAGQESEAEVIEEETDGSERE